MESTKLRFTADDRDLIRKQVIGKPTGVIADIGGFKLDLLPLTTEQAREFFKLVDFFVNLQSKADGEGNVVKSLGDIGTEADRMEGLLKSVLRGSAIASDLIDESNGGEELFNEWFDALPFKELLTTVGPLILQAQGLGTLLGNLSTPLTKGAAAT